MSKPTETELLPEQIKCERCGTEVSRYDSLRGYCMICAGDAVDAARTPSPTPSSAEARARARELVDEWRNTWRGMSDACMTANRIDLIDRIARLSTPQPTLQQAIECVRDYRKWYDEKMFTPVTTEETQAVHKQFDGMVDRISAESARRTIDNLITALSSLASPSITDQ